MRRPRLRRGIPISTAAHSARAVAAGRRLAEGGEGGEGGQWRPGGMLACRAAAHVAARPTERGIFALTLATCLRQIRSRSSRRSGLAAATRDSEALRLRRAQTDGGHGLWTRLLFLTLIALMALFAPTEESAEPLAEAAARRGKPAHAALRAGSGRAGFPRAIRRPANAAGIAWRLARQRWGRHAQRVLALQGRERAVPGGRLRCLRRGRQAGEVAAGEHTGIHASVLHLPFNQFASVEPRERRIERLQ